MQRRDEIKELLKHLLGKAKDAINTKAYSDDFKEVLKSSQEVVVISKQIETYMTELNEITD